MRSVPSGIPARPAITYRYQQNVIQPVAGPQTFRGPTRGILPVKVNSLPSGDFNKNVESREKF